MMLRHCTVCEHGEFHHTGHGCYGKGGAGGEDAAICACSGFCAHELSEKEEEVLRNEKGKQRGQIGNAEVLDEYSAIREHLGEIMEKVSQ